MGCTPEGAAPSATGLEGLLIADLTPRVAVPGTQLQISGSSFLDAPLGLSSLRLVGTYGSQVVDTLLPAQFVDFDQMTVPLSSGAIGLLGGPGSSFDGQAAVSVVFAPDGSRHESWPIYISLSIHEELTPTLEGLDGDGNIYVNDAIEVDGDGLLLGGDEGETLAVVVGCFTPQGAEQCQEVGPTEVVVRPKKPGSRSGGSFPFSPRIAGIFPGSFSGQVVLENHHADGGVTQSDAQSLDVTLAPAAVSAFADSASLGQFLDIEGGGFIGGDEGLTIIELNGEYIPDDGPAVEIEGVQLVPDFVDGTVIRYVLSDEEDPLGELIDLRSEPGLFAGTATPSIVFEGQEFVGEPTQANFHIDDVKQVVWVQFNGSYVESLRTFGLRALDSSIRERVLTVMRRDYAGINVEIREEEPTDYKWYATLEISGPDPNGRGLLGYDNTFGKDFNNERLYDHIGGVNALTLDNGDPGFGGVFIESLFTFSMHPRVGEPGLSATPLFDAVFDPFRPDTGTEVTSADLATGLVPTLSSGELCPAYDRHTQIACAVWSLGSIVGSTASHELGHSLGLADPIGEDFHNFGDEPGRLMDEGGNRPFEERAELLGTPPGAFCVESYDYLRAILPTDEPEEHDGREHC